MSLVSFGGMGMREKLTVSAFLDCVHGSGSSGSLKKTVEGSLFSAAVALLCAIAATARTALNFSDFRGSA